MKIFKTLLSLTICLAILLAATFSASAIGFNAEEKYNSVFVIISGNSLGSGFAIGENCVITNAHVIGNTRSIQINTYSGEKYSATLIGMDEDLDIAVLSVSGAKFPILKLGDHNKMNTGDDVYAIGAPKSMAYTLTKGVISAKERVISKHTYIQTDAAINEGNSGGPLVNDAGEVIGINTLKMLNSEGIGLAIPMNVLRDFVKSLNIETDENGNVTSTLGGAPSGNGGSETPSTDKDDDSETLPRPERSKKDSKNLILIIALVVSVLLNVLLFILLLLKKSVPDTIKIETDQSDRTDFDIDILE